MVPVRCRRLAGAGGLSGFTRLPVSSTSQLPPMGVGGGSARSQGA